MLAGLSQINIELTSRCNKHTLCGFCGHQNPKVFPNLKFGDISAALLYKIRDELPGGIIVQFHRDGEPIDYKELHLALDAFYRSGFITSIVTHGENLWKRYTDIINNCTTVTVSVFKGDPDFDIQFESVRKFLEVKQDLPPMVNIKIVGEMDGEQLEAWESLKVPIIRRVLHVPSGNHKYAKRDPTIPEVMVCGDFLSHPSVDWEGNLFICNRLDTEYRGLLGNLNDYSLDELWNGSKRKGWLGSHLMGKREDVPACKGCKFWGIATA